MFWLKFTKLQKNVQQFTVYDCWLKPYVHGNSLEAVQTIHVKTTFVSVESNPAILCCVELLD